MWIIAEDGRGINLSQATHLEVVDSADYIDSPADCQRPWAVMARFGWLSFYEVVCTRETEKECYEDIKSMTSDMCGWQAPQQRYLENQAQNTEETPDDDRN